MAEWIADRGLQIADCRNTGRWQVRALRRALSRIRHLPGCVGLALLAMLPAALAEAPPGGKPASGSAPPIVRPADVPPSLMDALAKRVDLQIQNASLDAVLEQLSKAAGIRVHSTLPQQRREIPVFSLAFANVPVSEILTRVASQAFAMVRPEVRGGKPGVVLAEPMEIVMRAEDGRVLPGYPPWSPEWPAPKQPGWLGGFYGGSSFGGGEGTTFRAAPPPPPPGAPGGFYAPPPGTPGGPPLRLPPSVRLTPYSVTALDANRFVVLSLGPEVANPVRVGEGEQATTIVMPMAVLTLYRVENGKIKEEASALHQIPPDQLRELVSRFRPPDGKAGGK